MFIKGDAEGGGFELVSIGNGLPNDLLVPKMNAIKHADGAAYAAVGRLQFAGIDERTQAGCSR